MKAFFWFFIGFCVLMAIGFLLTAVIAVLIPLMIPIGLVALIVGAFCLFRSPNKADSPDTPPTP